jgi:hypothetical protein
MGQARQTGAQDRLNVLVLYDAADVFTNTVREHLDAFSRFSRHRVAYAPAAGTPLTFSLDAFDVVILHYSIRLAYDWHLSPEFAWALKQFRGLKVAFLQDEYDNTGRACQWIDQLGVRLVFTCVPLEHVREMYAKVDHDRVTFLPTLTGYLPIDSDLANRVKPLSERPIVIGYRGRALPFRYGRLAREKLTIGVQMRAACKARGVHCDIEWTEDKRIYGDAWIDFIASCRATLGTESGSNVFDFDGSLMARINAALKANPRLTYEEVEAKYLAGLERDGLMNQVSPRIFEAVALKTGLILFEGAYSRVVRPNEHFIPLKKDFSNVDDVLRRVQDDRELSDMTDRAYRDVIGSGRYAYEAFVREVDTALEAHAAPPRSADWPAPSEGWTRTVAHPQPVPRPSAVYRFARSLAGRLYRGLGIKAAHLRIRARRGARALFAANPELEALAREGHTADALRLALLKHICGHGPSVVTRLWSTIRFEPGRGRIVFTTHPAHDLPGPIAPGRPVLDRALAAVAARKVGEIGWEFAGVLPKVTVNVDKLGVVDFEWGPDRAFRLTALERLADVDPQRAVRLLADVADGVRAPAEPVAEDGYRRAS